MSRYLELIESLISEASKFTGAQPTAVWRNLTRLLEAPAPNHGCTLPGAVGEVIYDLAVNWDLPVQIRQGNILIKLGAQSNARCDLLICSHMDRPSFRVADMDSMLLDPLCAVRVPGTSYTCPAVAVRAQEGRVRIASEGAIRFMGAADERYIRYIASEGRLQTGDTVMMRQPLAIEDGRLSAPGLDNASGVLVNLMFARLLHACSDALEERNVQIICAFTDQEEGPPNGLFGQGAARLTHELEAPYVGFINIDAHNAGADAGAKLGGGVSHAFVSGRGRGSVVPLAFQEVAESLAASETVGELAQLNYGYVSRSDDMLLSLWSQCVGLIGLPLENAHTAEETIHLKDLLAAQGWLAAFVPVALERGLS